MGIENTDLTSENASQDMASEANTRYVLSRRDFLVSGALAGTLAVAAAVTGTVQASEAEPGPTDPAQQQPDYGDSGEDLGSESVYELIDSYNQYAVAYNIRLHPGFTFGSEFTHVDELADAVNHWGGLADNLSMPEYVKTGLLRVPISKLYCDNVVPQLPAFTLVLDTGTTRYEYERTSYGYMAVKLPPEDASTASAANSEDNGGNNPIDKTRYIIDDDNTFTSLAGTGSTEAPRGVRYSSFAEAAISNFSENSLNRFSRELYPAIRSAYDPDLVIIATADGQFSGIDSVPIYGNYSTALNIDFGGFPYHAVLLHAALHGIFGSNYDSVQVNPKDIDQYVEERDQMAKNGYDVKPSVICLPFSISDRGRIITLNRILKGRDVNKLRTIIVASTPNEAGEIQLEDELHSSVIFCSTVRKDGNGNLYMPQNRVSIANGAIQDKLFLFPDQSDALGVEFGAEMVDSQLYLLPEFYNVRVSGASLSTLVATTFISAIISRLLASGEEYSEELIMQTLRDLCQEVKVGEVTGRVPDVDKVRAFFGEKIHLPSLSNRPFYAEKLHLPSLLK